MPDEPSREAAEPDDLYGLPLEEFTATRDQLVKRLVADGDDERAAQVRKLRKPSIAAWALNQAARSHPEAVERLMASHRGLRAATSGTELQEASAERQRSVAELTALAVAELTAGGRPAGGTTKDRITSTLLAVAADPAGEEELAAGRLAREIEPSGGGWGDLGLTPAPTTGPGGRAKKAAERARAKAERLLRDAEAAEKQVERAQHALDEAKRRAQEMRAAAEQAAAEAGDAETANS